MTDSKPNGTSADTEVARLVVEQNLASQEDVDQCLVLVAQNQQTLAGTLVQQGVVTERQMVRIRARLEESRRGTQIPGYQLLERLGAGAMATVFKARQLSLDRVVAIKVLSRKLSENKDYVERFYKEGKAAGKLNHANIAQAFDVGEAGAYHYFVMEFVDGYSLFDEMEQRRGRPFSESHALRVIIQVAKALEHAHSQGLIHRDVKPKNIMITRQGDVKLVDLGLARPADDNATAKAEAGRAFGTPYYISPEQIRGEVDIDFRADIYSLGATLYHLVTGHVPFEGATPVAVMQKHLKETLVPPDHVNTKLSAGLGEVVETMMAKDRRRRYASTGDLLIDLEAIAAGSPPPQARKHITADVLSGLAAEQTATPSPADTVEMASPDASNWKLYAILLAAALGVSVLLNLIQLAMK
ncbi:MAG: serine/threonine protein kinase [Phycisphaerae bacterium]|nr:serine/threonine protein kinase [Phycisphaerae bacterium]